MEIDDIPIKYKQQYNGDAAGISRVLHLQAAIRGKQKEKRPTNIVKKEAKGILQTEKPPPRKQVLEHMQDISAIHQNKDCIRVVPVNKRKRSSSTSSAPTCKKTKK